MANNQTHLTFATEIEPAKKNLFRLDNKLGWILCGYAGKTHITLQAQGNGDVEEFIPLLKDNEIQFVLIRLPKGSYVKGEEDSGSLDVMMTWIGPAVKRIERGVKKGDVAGVSNHLQPHHIDIEALNKANISADTVRHRAFGAGSHVID